MSHDAAAPHQAHHPALAHHFDSLAQQSEATTLGMWVFLVTEVLFFGGLFASYTVYRALYLPGFEIGSHLLDVRFGAANTAVLIGSSLSMALAIRAAQTGQLHGTEAVQVGSDVTQRVGLSLSRLHRFFGVMIDRRPQRALQGPVPFEGSRPCFVAVGGRQRDAEPGAD